MSWCCGLQGTLKTCSSDSGAACEPSVTPDLEPNPPRACMQRLPFAPMLESSAALKSLTFPTLMLTLFLSLALTPDTTYNLNIVF